MVDLIDVVSAAQYGIGDLTLPLTFARVATGTFFAVSGFNKLFNQGRHHALLETFKRDKVPDISFMQWWVPTWEFFGGIMVGVGFLTAFAAGILSVICMVACLCEAKKRVDAYNPINEGDRIVDYLYLPEVLYLALLFVFIGAGGGTISVDNMLVGF